MINQSTPTLTKFDPGIIPFQKKVLYDIRKGFDYSLGVHEILLSGAVGSSKSTVMSHIAITHCLFNPGCRFLIGRLSMPALRSTLFNKILEHIGNDLREGIDYWVNETTASIRFRNGSEIISRSWADKKFFKVRSLELSGAAIEETVENELSDFYYEIKMRVGRLPHVKENIIINATNPGDPSHWLHKYFIESKSPTRHVYYSVTTDNPFLPKQYVEQLKTDLDPKMAQRMLYGKWIEIKGESLYYAYSEKNFKIAHYVINEKYPIHIMWDFNIGVGKPMSCAVSQYIDDVWHIFDEVIIEGVRTTQIIEELDEKKYLDGKYKIIINGDASGKNRDTRNSKSDYDIIRHELAKRGVQFEYHVPIANPPIRTRHNTVNAYCCNALGERRLFVYEKAKTVDEGFRLTKLKKGADYIEDDSKSWQHVSTACGYGIMYEKLTKDRKPQGVIRL